MVQTTFQWQAADGQTMFGRQWSTTDRPRAVVCIIHGLGEHSGRYDWAAQQLTHRGFEVAGFDHRGHGQSGGRRGDTPSYKAMLHDIALFCSRQRQRHLRLPLVLYGHSMGGALTLSYLLSRERQIRPAAAVVTGPALELPVPPVKRTLVRFLSAVLPHLCMANGIAAEALSREPEVVQAYQQDPLVHDRISLLLARYLLEKGQATLGNASRLDIPLLLMHGTADSVCRIEGSRRFAAAAPQARLVEWPECWHELHNEPEKEDVLHYAADWLDAALEPFDGPSETDV